MTAMASEKSLAIVLRVVEFSETSCVVTFFSREFGKLGALAKGARRPKSPFEAALDLLAVCRIVFLRKSSDGLDLLTESKLERRFRSAAVDLTRLYAGYYVAELLREMTDHGDPHPELFDMADSTLAQIDASGDIASLVLRWELAALRWLGHLPALDDCASCGGQVNSSGRVPFGQQAGGILCAQCRVGERQVVSVSAGAIDALRRMSAAVANGELPELDRTVRGELRGLMNHYFSHLLGQRPRMLAYLSDRLC